MSSSESNSDAMAMLMSGLALPPVYDDDDDEFDDDDDENSRTTKTLSQHQSKHSGSSRTSFSRSHSGMSIVSSSDGNLRNQTNKSSTSTFEINCSPMPHTGNETSYYEQTRSRRKQQQQQQHHQQEEEEPQHQLTPKSQGQQASSVSLPQTPLLPPSKEPPSTNNTEPKSTDLPSNGAQKEIQQHTSLLEAQNEAVPGGKISDGHPQAETKANEKSEETKANENSVHETTKPLSSTVEDNNDYDVSSVCTLINSAMSLEHGSYNGIQFDDDGGDNTIDTGNMESSNMDTDSNSNGGMDTSSNSNGTRLTDPFHGNSIHGSAASFSSVRSLSSSVSRGEEHISSRMKKYGLYNLHEMKRKQQQRRNSRTQKKGSYGNPVTGPNTVSLNSISANSVSASSIQTEGVTENSPSRSFPSGEPHRAADVPTRIRTAPLHVQMAVEEIHRWLFTEGGHFQDVQTLMTQYSLYVREHFGIPLDRLYYGGVGLHPKLTAYLWKWEAHGEFVHSEMPPEVFARRNEIFSPDEPFCILEQGRADHVRIRDTDSYIPPDTSKWFRPLNYKDYFALPDIHRGVSKGGLAWATRSPDGFCDDDIQFFRMTHAALTTIMRLHTNDLVLKTLTDRMESEIEERTNELAAANRKLEEANDEISRHASKQLEHFACMSHEIRTPLNCIVGLSSLMLETPNLNEELVDTIHMIYNSADLVQGVVNDVLDYAKIESGLFELDIRPNDLQTTLNGVVHSISNKLQDKNVDVRTSYGAMLGKTMTTDSRRLQQILYNILGNAAKFSREGTTIDFSVRIVLSPEEAGASKPKIRFSIKDHGKGIEEKNFEKIFQPFSQASKETQTLYGGTGLGLSITKNLVARLGGTISIKSEINEFTEFVVDLPYDDELVDCSKYREKMSEICIVILDPTERPIDAPSLEDDEFVPFPTEVIEKFELRVMRCSSWGELESKLGLRKNIQENYVFIAHEDIEERQGILNVEKLVRRERCSWFTFGSDSSLHEQSHFKTLTGIFPSAIIDKISDGVNAQRSLGTSVSTVSSVDSKSTNSQEGPIMDLEQHQEEVAAAQQPTGLFSILSMEANAATDSQKSEVDSGSARRRASTKTKKKFATKYPPRTIKVLIVDDNLINQKVLDRVLQRLGVSDISIVNNGKKAVEITATTQFDCIFMDMEMPVMGGLEACKLIVERDKDAARVAFVTAHDIQDIREKADAAGAYGYISKPLKMKEIHEFLKNLEKLKGDDKPQDLPCLSKTKETTAAKKKRPTPQKKKRCTKQYPPRKMKILVAEDNLINQKVLDRILKRVGVSDITIVDNGKKAVDASESTKFDCILMDMQMPIMDGLEACKIIVKRDGTDGPKIVFVTAHALAEFREKALAAGAFDFITKPFKMEDIDNVLKIVENVSEEPISSAPNEEIVATQPGGRTSGVDVIADVSCSSEESSNIRPKKSPRLVHPD